MDVQLYWMDGPIGKRELWWTFRLIVQREPCSCNLLMLLQWLRWEKMFELLDKWVEQVGEENVIQVITDNHSSYVMIGNKYYFLNCYLLLKFELFILISCVNLLSTISHREVVRIKTPVFVLDTMCCALPWLDIGKYWQATKHQEDIGEGYITKWVYL